MTLSVQSKKVYSYLFFVSLLFSVFISAYISYKYEIIVGFVLILLLLLFGSIGYGFLSKNQILSAILGFLLYPVMLIGVDFNQISLYNFNIEFLQSYIFSEVFVLSILSALIGWLAASKNDDKNKLIFRYMIATFLFMFYLMIFVGSFTPN